MAKSPDCLVGTPVVLCAKQHIELLLSWPLWPLHLLCKGPQQPHGPVVLCVPDGPSDPSSPPAQYPRSQYPCLLGPCGPVSLEPSKGVPRPQPWSLCLWCKPTTPEPVLTVKQQPRYLIHTWSVANTVSISHTSRCWHNNLNLRVGLFRRYGI